MKNKYFNVYGKSADMYVYGYIVNENENWFGEESKVDVDPQQFQQELEELDNQGITDINIYINSGGGNVFASSTIVSQLKRQQEKGVKIHSFIDGICASAATYLCMVADDINVYSNSVMMIHKPMSCAWGNANDFEKEIQSLDAIENNMMVPMYASKAKCEKEEIKQLINDETWFNGNKDDEKFIGNFFDINYIEESKSVVACIDTSLANKYKNVPKNLIKNKTEKEKIDYSMYDEIILKLKK